MTDTQTKEIDYEHFLNVSSKTSRKTAVTEASSLGWSPGEWPKAIEMRTPNGKSYRFERISLYGEGARYRHHYSHSTIVVLND